MIIHWLPLLCGLFFGLIPPLWLINSECRYRQFEMIWKRLSKPAEPGQIRRRWWKLPIVWIDPVRGYVTGFLLSDAFRPVHKAVGIEKLLPLIVTASLLLLVMWVQTSGRGKDSETLSPSSFLAGLMVALMPLVVALSAITIGAATAIAMSGFSAGYFMAAVSTACIGYIFLGRSLWLPIFTVIVASPMLINWFRRGKLVMPIRG
jgi:hypothetical protein